MLFLPTQGEPLLKKGIKFTKRRSTKSTCHLHLIQIFFREEMYLMENAENALFEPLDFKIFAPRPPLQPLASRFQAHPPSP